MIREFLRYLESFEILSKETGKFQIFNGTVKGSHLIIYRSGIVIYEENVQLIAILEGFFMSTTIPLPRELEITSIKLEKMAKTKSKRSFDRIQSSYWISKDQLKNLVQRLKSKKYKIINHRNGSISITNAEGEVLDISKNQLVQSKFMKKFLDDLFRIFDEYPIHGNFQELVSVESVGKYSQLGPSIYVAVLLSSDQVISLQKNGIRHMDIGRGSNPSQYLDYLKSRNINPLVLKFEPEEINSAQFEEGHDSKLDQLFDSILAELSDKSSSKLIYDPKLKNEVLRNKRLSGLKLEESLQGICSAVASIYAHFHYDEWLKENSIKHQFKFNISNLSKILNLKESEKFVKLKYVPRLKDNHS